LRIKAKISKSNLGHSVVYLSYVEKGDIASLFSFNVYSFQFNDIISISNIPGATPKRVFSYHNLFKGISIEFEVEGKADSFLKEIKKYISEHIQYEQLIYERLAQKSSF
jgi:hypothetical protein